MLGGSNDITYKSLTALTNSLPMQRLVPPTMSYRSVSDFLRGQSAMVLVPMSLVTDDIWNNWKQWLMQPPYTMLKVTQKGGVQSITANETTSKPIDASQLVLVHQIRFQRYNSDFSSPEAFVQWAISNPLATAQNQQQLKQIFGRFHPATRSLSKLWHNETLLETLNPSPPSTRCTVKIINAGSRIPSTTTTTTQRTDVRYSDRSASSTTRVPTGLGVTTVDGATHNVQAVSADASNAASQCS
jgi:hypothetical protein